MFANIGFVLGKLFVCRCAMTRKYFFSSSNIYYICFIALTKKEMAQAKDNISVKSVPARLSEVGSG